MAARPGAPCSLYGNFAIFVEGSNFYHTIRDLGLQVDYRRLLEYFSRDGSLVKATYYTPLLEDKQSPDWLMRLLTWLSYNGYSVVTKQVRSIRRQVASENGGNYWISELQGDLDMEITVDMLSQVCHCDTIVLFSGDGGFVPVLKALQQEGCRVVVVSSERTRDSSVADEMRRQADKFIDIATIADAIRRQS